MSDYAEYLLNQADIAAMRAAMAAEKLLDLCAIAEGDDSLTITDITGLLGGVAGAAMLTETRLASLCEALSSDRPPPQAEPRRSGQQQSTESGRPRFMDPADAAHDLKLMRKQAKDELLDLQQTLTDMERTHGVFGGGWCDSLELIADYIENAQPSGSQQAAG